MVNIKFTVFKVFRGYLHELTIFFVKSFLIVTLYWSLPSDTKSIVSALFALEKRRKVPILALFWHFLSFSCLHKSLAYSTLSWQISPMYIFWGSYDIKFWAIITRSNTDHTSLGSALWSGLISIKFQLERLELDKFVNITWPILHLIASLCLGD